MTFFFPSNNTTVRHPHTHSWHDHCNIIQSKKWSLPRCATIESIRIIAPCYTLTSNSSRVHVLFDPIFGIFQNWTSSHLAWFSSCLGRPTIDDCHAIQLAPCAISDYTFSVCIAIYHRMESVYATAYGFYRKSKKFNLDHHQCRNPSQTACNTLFKSCPFRSSSNHKNRFYMYEKLISQFDRSHLSGWQLRQPEVGPAIHQPFIFSYISIFRMISETYIYFSLL